MNHVPAVSSVHTPSQRGIITPGTVPRLYQACGGTSRPTLDVTKSAARPRYLHHSLARVRHVHRRARGRDERCANGARARRRVAGESGSGGDEKTAETNGDVIVLFIRARGAARDSRGRERDDGEKERAAVGSSSTTARRGRGAGERDVVADEPDDQGLAVAV